MTENLLDGATVYLSGPMDFVADREVERRTGWRTRMTEYLESRGVRVFDPWYKPAVRNLGRYGDESDGSIQPREEWSYTDATKRWELGRLFWPVMHIDLRMVDLSDFVIACCPTNLYSVGTPHEVVVARLQHKPVLLVTPKVQMPGVQALATHLNQDPSTAELWVTAMRELQVGPNPRGIPSAWYMALVDSESFFDGFGFSDFQEEFGWEPSYLDSRETNLDRPLLPYLERLTRGEAPTRYTERGPIPDDDWLLLAERARQAVD